MANGTVTSRRWMRIIALDGLPADRLVGIPCQLGQRGNGRLRWRADLSRAWRRGHGFCGVVFQQLNQRSTASAALSPRAPFLDSPQRVASSEDFVLRPGRHRIFACLQDGTGYHEASASGQNRIAFLVYIPRTPIVEISFANRLLSRRNHTPQESSSFGVDLWRNVV